MDIKIVIPSKGRASTILTHKYVANTITCVEESELALYKEHNPEMEFVTHPDNVYGLKNKREWIYEKFGDVFMMDDDIKGFSRMTQTAGESAKVSPELAYWIVQNAGNLAKIFGCYLFGFNALKRPEHYIPHRPYRLSGSILGGAFGILKGATKLKMDSRVVMAYEYFLSGLNAFYYRKAFFDDRYCMVQDGYANRLGGAASLRTAEMEKRELEMLKYYFGDAIVQEPDLSKRKKEFDKRLKIPF